jgi:hypothetical protein
MTPFTLKRVARDGDAATPASFIADEATAASLIADEATAASLIADAAIPASRTALGAGLVSSVPLAVVPSATGSCDAGGGW